MNCWALSSMQMYRSHIHEAGPVCYQGWVMVLSWERIQEPQKLLSFKNLWENKSLKKRESTCQRVEPQADPEGVASRKQSGTFLCKGRWTVTKWGWVSKGTDNVFLKFQLAPPDFYYVNTRRAWFFTMLMSV